MTATLDLSDALPEDAERALLMGRLWQPGVGPILVACKGGALVDLSRVAPTSSHPLDWDIPPAAVRAALPGAPRVAELAAVLANSEESVAPLALTTCRSQGASSPARSASPDVGDGVRIGTLRLGTPVNRGGHCARAAPWQFGIVALMNKLAQRGLL